MKIFSIICVVLAALFSACTTPQEEKQVYLFTSFHEPATDGLRLLYSQNGVQWNDLDTVLLAQKQDRVA